MGAAIGVQVVLAGTYEHVGQQLVIASAYSSGSGSDIVYENAPSASLAGIADRPSSLVGNTLHWFLRSSYHQYYI